MKCLVNVEGGWAAGARASAAVRVRALLIFEERPAPTRAAPRGPSAFNYFFRPSNTKTLIAQDQASDAESVRQQPVKLWLFRAWRFESSLMHRRRDVGLKGKPAVSKTVFPGSNPGIPAIRGRLGTRHAKQSRKLSERKRFCEFDSRPFLFCSSQEASPNWSWQRRAKSPGAIPCEFESHRLLLFSQNP